MVALEAQVKQLGLQAAQDCERLAKDRTLTLQLLNKVSLIWAQFKIVLHDMTATCTVCSFRMRLSGAGEVVRPGEEVPHPHRREELPEKQQHHVRGEQASHRGLRRNCSFRASLPLT